MGSRAPVGDLSPQRSPSRRPGKAPLREGMRTLPGARSSNPAGLAGAGGRRLPGFSALQSAKAPRPRGDWVEGSLPALLPAPPTPGRAGRWGAPAPSPTPLETWAPRGRREGMLPSPGRGRRGEGR